MMLRSILKSKLASAMKKLGVFVYKKSRTIESLNLITKKDKQIIADNYRFKDIHTGQRAFIIANGPSVERQNLAPLKDEITFVMNGFYKHPLVGSWQPNYYSLLDFLYFQDNQNSYPFYQEMRTKIKDSRFFLPLSRGYGYNETHKQLPPDKTSFIATYGESLTNSIDLTSQIMRFQTVAAFSIAIAIYMNCNPIYLMGYDHNYLANTGIDTHFYQGGDGLKGSAAEKAATQPLYSFYSYDFMMKAMLHFWENYRTLQKIAIRRNIKIFNATDGGFLDVFPRVKYEGLFHL